MEKTEEQVRERARELYQDDECEIDDDAQVNPPVDGGGRWVQAWVWVPADESGC